MAISSLSLPKPVHPKDLLAEMSKLGVSAVSETIESRE